MPISSTRRLMEQKVSLEHTTHPYSASLLSERRPSSSIHTTRASPPSIPIKAGRRAGHKCLGLGMLSAIREQRIQRRALAWCSWAQARRAEGSAAPRRLAPERLADCRTCNSGKRGSVRMRRRLDLRCRGLRSGVPGRLQSRKTSKNRQADTLRLSGLTANRTCRGLASFGGKWLRFDDSEYPMSCIICRERFGAQPDGSSSRLARGTALWLNLVSLSHQYPADSDLG